MIYEQIDRLLSYGIITGLIEESDNIYVRNRMLALLKLDSYKETGEKCDSIKELEEILDSITDYAVENGLIENDSIVYRDMFDTALMDILTPYKGVDMNKKVVAIFFAILAAGLYAINIPLSKLLLNYVEPTMLASYLYLGAGLGIGIVFLVTNWFA